jgi:hypothetical protein
MAGERNLRLVARTLSKVCCTLSLLGVPLVAGCTATPPAAVPTREHWVSAYVFGIWGKAELDVRDDCPTTGAARVRIGATWSTFLVSVLTVGMYTPHEVLVHCRAKP